MGDGLGGDDAREVGSVDLSGLGDGRLGTVEGVSGADESIKTWVGDIGMYVSFLTDCHYRLTKEIKNKIKNIPRQERCSVQSSSSGYYCCYGQLHYAIP